MNKRIIIGFIALLSFVAIPQATQAKKVKNVICLIGDGMGLAQVAYIEHFSPTPLFIDRAQAVGLVRTHSASSKITDSAAAATALATGKKSYNGAIGVTPDSLPAKNLIERAEEAGFATGLVATYAITHATPAGFIAHNVTRKDGYAIAEDFLKTDIDLFIGGGRKYFEKNKEEDLTKQLRAKGYNVVYSMEDVMAHNDGKLAALLAENAMPLMIKGRGDALPKSTDKALDLLKDMSKKGFFIMIEGSQIDGMAHANNAEGLVAEVLDFDKAVKLAFDFADQNKNTLVIVLADHETGGLTLTAVRSKENPADTVGISASFSTRSHTGVMVPVYAYGEGAQEFTGVMDNTDIPKKIAKLMGIKWE